MVSAFQDYHRGFWLHMTKEELDLVNFDKERARGLSFLTTARGVRATGTHCASPIRLRMCWTVLRCWQPVLLCYWSSGHNGMGEGRLTTGTISCEG